MICLRGTKTLGHSIEPEMTSGSPFRGSIRHNQHVLSTTNDAVTERALFRKLRQEPDVAPRVSRSMRGNRREQTSPEETLAFQLRQRSVRSYRRNMKALPGSPDFVFVGLRVAVQVHGCFWHRCPNVWLIEFRAVMWNTGQRSSLQTWNATNVLLRSLNRSGIW